MNNPRDVDGHEIEVGSHVEFINADINADTRSVSREFPIGSDGCVSEIHDESHGQSVCLILPQRGRWWFPGQAFRIIEEFTEKDEPDTPARALQIIQEATPRMILLNGKWHALELVGISSADELLSTIQQSYAKKLSKIRSEYTRREAKIQALLSESMPMPEVSLARIKERIRVYRVGAKIHYLLPFKYHPTHIEETSSKSELSDSHKNELSNDSLFCDLWADRTGHGGIILRDQDYRHFKHYHSRGEAGDCAGLVVENVTCFGKALELRDAYERTLRLIVGHNLGHSTPEGLPTYDALRADAHEVDDAIQATGGWSVDSERPRESERVARIGEIEVGTLVRAGHADAIPRTLRGCIGQVVVLDSDPPNIGIEFLFAAGLLHNCGGHAQTDHGYFINVRNLTIAAPGARRSRNPSRGEG